MNYSYDAYGRKISQEESFWQYNGGDQEDKQLRTQKTAFFYQGTKLIKEYTGSGDPLAEYYYGNNRVIARKMFGYHGRKAHGHDEKLRTRGGLMYYHYDTLGNVMDLTDHLGEGVIKYRWGTPSGACLPAPWRRTAAWESPARSTTPKPDWCFSGPAGTTPWPGGSPCPTLSWEG